MLSDLLKRLVRSAGVYDLLQFLAGDRQLQKRLGPHIRALPAGSWVADIGGGTGLPNLSSAGINDIKYVCLDLDWHKLQRFRAKYRDGLGVAANATRCPLKADSLDAVLCVKVTHHLSDTELDVVLAEVIRIVKPGGTIILADAIRSDRLLARFLWQFDRGTYPRTAGAIRGALSSRYVVAAWEQFRVAIFHDFVLCTASKASVPEGGKDPAG